MLMVAHRGASAYAPENTLASFRLALEMRARAVEFDVHQTKDDELVVIHDDDLKRVGKRRDRIARLTRRELSAVDVGSWFNKVFHAERVPSLAETYDLCAARAEMHLEIKHGSRVYAGIEKRIVQFLHERRALEKTLISSFDHQALFEIRAIEPRARLGYLRGLTLLPRAFREMDELKAESLNCSMRQIDARTVRACHDRGLNVLIYTVNTQKDADRMGKIGVDGVFTNFPELKAP